jgi:hypothetical protein
MDILSILKSLKGKVLDAAHFEMLKHAYELQDQNLKQLKSNNNALKESNDLLKDKVSRLEGEVTRLSEVVSDLEKKIPTASTLQGYVPSRAAAAILDHCVKRDITEFLSQELLLQLPCSQIEGKTGIDELRNHKILDLASVGQRGPKYFLTAAGRAFVLQRGRK